MCDYVECRNPGIFRSVRKGGTTLSLCYFLIEPAENFFADNSVRKHFFDNGVCAYINRFLIWNVILTFTHQFSSSLFVVLFKVRQCLVRFRIVSNHNLSGIFNVLRMLAVGDNFVTNGNRLFAFQSCNKYRSVILTVIKLYELGDCLYDFKTQRIRLAVPRLSNNAQRFNIKLFSKHPVCVQGCADAGDMLFVPRSFHINRKSGFFCCAAKRFCLTIDIRVSTAIS